MTERPATRDWAAATEWPTVPGYEVLGELGRGGMGVVYKARQLSTGRTVALKLLRDAALAGPQGRARFRIEAEAAARTRHPNVVEIYEVGEHRGLPFFAMELVEGGGLDKHLAGNPLPAAEAAGLIRTLALAVHHAHAQNVIHRDLKPANILLGMRSAECGMRNEDQDHQSPAEGVGLHSAFRIPHSALKIADFGLAKRLDSESTAWTHDGAVLGTAGYMAPEQAAGRVREVGPAADIYALGAILYECLTGLPPFQADTWNRALEQVLHDEPEPPTRSNPDVPRDLETVCLKCLEKEPARRYRSAADLADDLGRFLEGGPIAAQPPSEGERLARLAARDGFQIESEIGRGPRSVVYRALYGPLRQPVALKVFPAGACTREEWESRLRQGAELWASLAHPHIVPVQRAGWWDGRPYVAAEFVPQGNLADRIAGRPYPILDALRLAEQVAEIVSYLHRQGVVHGNLKPSNVLLAADGIPRLADFRLSGGLSISLFSPEHMGEGPAGVGYLAPELARDPGADPRPYTDIYGLGLIIYELLTGRPPFAGADAGETLEQVCSHDPVPPSRLNPDVKPHLEAVCLRCLRKDPWRRYYRIYDLVRRLRYLQEYPDGPAMPESRWPRPWGSKDAGHGP